MNVKNIYYYRKVCKKYYEVFKKNFSIFLQKYKYFIVYINIKI